MVIDVPDLRLKDRGLSQALMLTNRELVGSATQKNGSLVTSAAFFESLRAYPDTCV